MGILSISLKVSFSQISIWHGLQTSVILLHHIVVILIPFRIWVSLTDLWVAGVFIPILLLNWFFRWSCVWILKFLSRQIFDTLTQRGRSLGMKHALRRSLCLLLRVLSVVVILLPRGEVHVYRCIMVVNVIHCIFRAYRFYNIYQRWSCLWLETGLELILYLLRVQLQVLLRSGKWRWRWRLLIDWICCCSQDWYLFLLGCFNYRSINVNKLLIMTLLWILLHITFIFNLFIHF